MDDKYKIKIESEDTTKKGIDSVKKKFTDFFKFNEKGFKGLQTSVNKYFENFNKKTKDTFEKSKKYHTSLPGGFEFTYGSGGTKSKTPSNSDRARNQSRGNFGNNFYEAGSGTISVLGSSNNTDIALSHGVGSIGNRLRERYGNTENQNKTQPQNGNENQNGLGGLLSGAGGKVLGGIGIALALGSKAYQMASERASAFRNEGSSQMDLMYSSGVLGNQVGGFYGGAKLGRGGSNSITGQQQGQFYSAYNSQMQKTGIMGNNVGLPDELMRYNVMGMSTAEIGNYAGTMNRFNGIGNDSTNNFSKSMQMAENVGMGGARSKEFLDDLMQAVQEGVQNGSGKSQDDMLKSLGILMNTNDERLKAIAPQIFSQSQSVMNQAGTFKGGAESANLFQAIAGAHPGESLMQINQRLSGKNSDWSSNARDALNFSKNLYSDPMAQIMQFQQMMGLGNITDFSKIQDIMNLVAQGKTPQTSKQIEDIVKGRETSTDEANLRTRDRDYQETTQNLSQLNHELAKATNGVKDFSNNLVKGFSDFILNNNSGKSPTNSTKGKK